MTLNNNSFREIWNEIKKGEVILLFPHIMIDGDGLGSSTALCKAIRNKGQKAYIVLEDEIPRNIEFLEKNMTVSLDKDIVLNEDNSIILNGEEVTNTITILIDCSDLTRLPKRTNIFMAGDIKITLDHHRTADRISDYNYINKDAAATGEIIYELLDENNIQLDEDIAIALYTAITMDTGNFQYSNTSAKTHKIVSNLYNYRDTFVDISNLLYENNPFRIFKLKGKLFDSISLHQEGKVAFLIINQELLDETECEMSDADGISSAIRGIEGVEVSVVLKENKDSVKASFRSKDYFDVSKVCQKFGGGGHMRASGFSSNEDVETVKSMILMELENSNEWHY